MKAEGGPRVEATRSADLAGHCAPPLIPWGSSSDRASWRRVAVELARYDADAIAFPQRTADTNCTQDPPLATSKRLQHSAVTAKFSGSSGPVVSVGNYLNAPASNMNSRTWTSSAVGQTRAVRREAGTRADLRRVEAAVCERS